MDVHNKWEKNDGKLVIEQIAIIVLWKKRNSSNF